MKLSYIQAFYKLISFFEVFFCFATSTHYHVYTDKRIGHKRFNILYLLGKKSCIITTAHQLQDFIATRLKWNMEMRHETFRLRYEFYNLVCKQVWLDR